MNDDLKVAIALAEYNSLRSEILQRISHRHALVTAAGALGAFAFFAAKSLSTHQMVVLGVAGVVLLVVWLDLGRLMLRCSDRVGQIEVALNDMAGATLMRWESERLGSGALRQIHTPRDQHRFTEDRPQ